MPVSRDIYGVVAPSLTPRGQPGRGGQDGSKRGRGRTVDGEVVEYRITNHTEVAVLCFSPLIILVELSSDQDAKKQYCLG